MTQDYNKSWEMIDETYDVIKRTEKERFITLTAAEIKQATNNKEPRNLTKYDSSIQRSEILRHNNLSILPSQNGIYYIGKFQAYTDNPFKQSKLTQMSRDKSPYFDKIVLENNYETLEDNITEANAIHKLAVSRYLETWFNERLDLTISGRKFTNEFCFYIKDSELEHRHKLNVNSVQIEVDAGFESKSFIFLIEAKTNFSNFPDFISRQLYYPYRYWQARTEKEIVPIFLNYESGIHHLAIYELDDKNDYNALKLKETRSVMIINPTTEDRLYELYEEIELIHLDKTSDYGNKHIIPFPQANSIELIIELINKQNNESFTSHDITEQLGYASRQGNYYLAALRYLKLVDRINNSEYILNEKGREIRDSNGVEKNRKIAKAMLSTECFYKLFTKYGLDTDKLGIEQIEDYLINNIRNYNYKKSVNRRRASTIYPWYLWLVSSDY